MIRPFEHNETDFDGQGKIFTAAKNSTTDHDMLIPAQRIINGGVAYFDKAVIGDTFTAQVVDVDGVYAPAGTVLNQWLTDWPVFPSKVSDMLIEQAGDIPAGVYLRIKYTSTGATDDVKIMIGYRLYKVIS